MFCLCDFIYALRWYLVMYMRCFIVSCKWNYSYVRTYTEECNFFFLACGSFFFRKISLKPQVIKLFSYPFCNYLYLWFRISLLKNVAHCKLLFLSISSHLVSSFTGFSSSNLTKLVVSFGKITRRVLCFGFSLA